MNNRSITGSGPVSGSELPASTKSVLVPVAEAYERWAPIYDRAPNPILAREERHLLPLLGDLSNKHVLDLACGTGRWLEKLIIRSPESAVGVDSSPGMLRSARKKRAIERRLIQAACESLPFRNAVFELLICSFALGHMRNLTAMVRELARVMKSGADVFVSDLHPEAYAHGWRTGFREGGHSLQIETVPRTVAEIVDTFCSNCFQCLTQSTLHLSDVEHPIFARAGKSSFFAEACQIPAVLVCHFTRT